MSNRMTAILLPAAFVIGLVLWQSGVSTPTLGSVVSTLGNVGGPLNFAFDWMGVITSNAMAMLIGMSAVWFASIAIVLLYDGEWKVYFEHLLWQVIIGLGLIAFVVPGLIFWALLAYRRGTISALLVVMGPIGSSIIASSDIWKKENYDSSAIRPTRTSRRHGIGPDLSTLKDSNFIIFLSIVLAIASVFGVVSGFVIANTPIWVHFVLYVALGITLAYAVVLVFTEKHLDYAIIAGAMFVTFLSMSDVMVSGLQFVGAVLPITGVEAGLLGSLSAENAIGVLGMFWGPAMGALIGNLIGADKSPRTVFIIIGVSVMAAVGVLILLV